MDYRWPSRMVLQSAEMGAPRAEQRSGISFGPVESRLDQPHAGRGAGEYLSLTCVWSLPLLSAPASPLHRTDCWILSDPQALG